MEISDFSQFIVPVVTGICFCIGYVIKNNIEFIPNNYIPLIVSVMGIFFNFWLNGWTISPEIVLGGLVSGLSSTGVYELVKHIK